MGPNNADRAEWARAALSTFIAEHGPSDEETALGDLMCNLLHLARQLGLQPRRVVDNAHGLFRDEERDEA